MAAALGPRFLDRQLAQGAAESWDECARHAALIEQIVPPPAAAPGDPTDDAARAAPTQMRLFGPPPAVQMDIFGTPKPDDPDDPDDPDREH